MKDLKSLRLKDREAKHLGLPVKSRNDKGYPKYKLSDEQVLDIKAFRNGGILEIADKLEVDPSTVKHLWKKTKEESVFIKNPLFVTAEEKTYFDLRDVIIKDLKKFSPKFTKIKRTGENDEGHLLVVDPADIHIGKLATAFETLMYCKCYCLLRMFIFALILVTMIIQTVSF